MTAPPLQLSYRLLISSSSRFLAADLVPLGGCRLRQTASGPTRMPSERMRAVLDHKHLSEALPQAYLWREAILTRDDIAREHHQPTFGDSVTCYVNGDKRFPAIREIIDRIDWQAIPTAPPISTVQARDACRAFAAELFNQVYSAAIVNPSGSISFSA